MQVCHPRRELPQTHPKKLETLSCKGHAPWPALLEMGEHSGASVLASDYPKEGQGVCDLALAFSELLTGVRKVAAY